MGKLYGEGVEERERLNQVLWEGVWERQEGSWEGVWEKLLREREKKPLQREGELV